MTVKINVNGKQIGDVSLRNNRELDCGQCRYRVEYSWREIDGTLRTGNVDVLYSRANKGRLLLANALREIEADIARQEFSDEKDSGAEAGK